MQQNSFQRLKEGIGVEADGTMHFVYLGLALTWAALVALHVCVNLTQWLSGSLTLGERKSLTRDFSTWYMKNFLSLSFSLAPCDHYAQQATRDSVCIFVCVYVSKMHAHILKQGVYQCWKVSND